MRWRLVVAAVLGVVVLAASQPSAVAGNGGPWGDLCPGGVCTGTSTGPGTPNGPSSGPGNRGTGGGGGQSCVYTPVFSGEYGPYFNPQAGPVFDPTGATNEPTPGQWYDEICDGSFVDPPVFVPNGGSSPGTVVQPEQLAQQALATAPFAPLTIVLSPPSDHEAVNFPVWLSVHGYTAVSASASAAGVTSTVTASPQSVTWSMGDGHSVTCDGPGVPYNPAESFQSQLTASGLPPCGYKYSESSASRPGAVFTVTATVHFSATWTVTGAPGGGSLGTVDRSASISVTVGEIQVLNQ